MKEEIREEVREEILDELEMEPEYDNEYYSSKEVEEDSFGVALGKALAEAVIEGVKEVFEENPEYKDELQEWAKKKAANAWHRVTGFFGKGNDEIYEDEDEELEDEKQEEYLSSEQENDIAEPAFEEENEKNISIEEARNIFLRMLKNYISFRKDFELLKKVGVFADGKDELAELLIKMEGLIQQYPNLLEEKTQEQIRSLLSEFEDESEKRKLLIVFQIAE